MAIPTKLEFLALILEHLETLGIPRGLLRAEYLPLRTRDFRVDYAIPELSLAFEYEGIFSRKSRHLTVDGYTTDCEKYGLISGVLGWRLVRITPKLISTGRAGPIIRESINCAVQQDRTECLTRPFRSLDKDKVLDHLTIPLDGIPEVA